MGFLDGIAKFGNDTLDAIASKPIGETIGAVAGFTTEGALNTLSNVKPSDAAAVIKGPPIPSNSGGGSSGVLSSFTSPTTAGVGVGMILVVGVVAFLLLKGK